MIRPKQTMIPKHHSTHTHAYAIVATHPQGDAGIGLAGVNFPVLRTATGWEVRLPDEVRGRPVIIRLYPIFADVDGIVYFIETAKWRPPGGEWKKIGRTDGLLELDTLLPHDEIGVEIGLEATPQSAPPSKKKRTASGDISARPEGGEG